MKTKKNATAIERALPIVAAALGEKLGVKVHIGGDSAYTNGASITIPAIECENNPEKREALWGYLAHEAAHVRFTNFAVRKKPGMHGAMLNIIEDARIERAMPEVYPGTKETLNALAAYMLQEGFYQIPTAEVNPALILQAYCLYALQADYVGQKVLQQTKKQTEHIVAQVFPDTTIVKLEALLGQIGSIKSTGEASELATKVIALIEEEIKEQEEKLQEEKQNQNQGQNQQGDGQGQNQGQNQQGDGQGQNQGQNQSQADGGSQSQADGDGQGDDQTGSGDSMNQGGETQSGESAGSSSSGSGADVASMERKLDALKEALSSTEEFDAFEQFRESLGNNADLSRSVESLNVPKGEKCSTATHSYGIDLLNSVAAESSRVRQQLKGIVQAKSRTANRTSRHGSRLSLSSLHRVAAGDMRVFRHNGEKIAPNAAVHILLDRSGSMGYDFDTVRDAGIALSLALEGIKGVSTAVTYFPSTHEYVRPVLNHGESVRPNAHHFHDRAGGSTPMAEAIWYAAYTTATRKEEKKIIMVVTDGSPDEYTLTEEVIAKCHESGVQVIGVGIGQGASGITGLIPNSIRINHVGELKTSLFSIMENAIL